MKIKINEKALNKLVQPAMKDLAEKLERDLAALEGSHQGKPLSTIKPKIRAIFKKHGGSVDEKTLNMYAKCISEGTRIEFKL